MIYGNIEGIRNLILDRLESLYEVNISRENVFESELSSVLCEVTNKIGREVSAAIDRKGRVISVAVGDSTTVEMPIIDVKEKKLSGVRIIHTHPSGVSTLSALDLSALIKLKLDCIVALSEIDGKCAEASIGFCTVENDILTAETIGPLSVEAAMNFDYLDRINYIESILKQNELEEDESERAILVGIESDESLEELGELAKACEVKVVHKVLQKRSKIDSAFYIGKGKVEEISMLRQALKANVIIFDDELDGSQVRNLEDTTGAKVIDRTTLILDIFARRARTKEAKIQVELAQLKYRLPRLMGLGTVLSRTGGGIGTRGPGEKKLETDRRHIRERIYDLNSELEKIKRHRETQREKRTEIPKVSLVGYTNAGKSTLRNKLCEIAMPKDTAVKEKVFEADMLFATLDITTRAIVLPDNRLITLTDTVGFVRKLPHDLVEAFKSTLEEVVYSDLLLHVVDASSSTALEQIKAVDTVLKELGAHEKSVLIVLNKIDKAEKENIDLIKDTYKENNYIEISAKENINLDTLLNEVSKALPYTLIKAEFLIPYSEQSAAAYLHRNANIEKEEYREEGTYIVAQVDEEVYNKCKKYIIQ
ncbi:GTPase HflX [Clostridium sp. SYSU_GA19001]|uniref:GTPase HflX n=1 Tax=Clostridium caldaquaticum TaxID=2940653 RepID=UPI0020778374|nr:GTPase HflX [Clostridium caldaquaticum]MCM8710896.1 GTPase HflX [Clostridium caldaquaticum]